MTRRSSSRSLEHQLAAVASQMGREVRAGATVEGALRSVSAGGEDHLSPGLASDLGRVVELVDRGVRMTRALAAWSSARSHPSVALFVAACEFAQRHGGRTSVAFDGAAAALAARAAVADETRALTAQARLSAQMLVALPIVGAVGFSLLDPTVGRTLLLTPVGWCCLVVGAVLDGLAVVVSRRLVVRVVGR